MRAARARDLAALGYVALAVDMYGGGKATIDPEQAAAIGYCFGGTVVLSMARAGVDLDGVVSFHGTLPVAGPPTPEQIEAEVLVLHGGADSYVTDAQMASFKRQMRRAGADFDIITYRGAKHSFTNPAADATAQMYDLDVGYDARAEQQSWLEMRTFLVRVLGH